MCVYKQKLPCCSLCGLQGHLLRTCPNRHCSNCLLPGHTYDDCLERAYWHKRCHRCGMTGHFFDVSSAMCVLVLCGPWRCVSVCWVQSVFQCVCCLFVCVCVSISWAILSLIKTDASQAVSGTHAPLVTPNNNPTERDRNGGGRETSRNVTFRNCRRDERKKIL